MKAEGLSGHHNSVLNPYWTFSEGGLVDFDWLARESILQILSTFINVFEQFVVYSIFSHVQYIFHIFSNVNM